MYTPRNDDQASARIRQRREQHTPGPWKRRSNGQIVQWSDTRVATIANVMSGDADARLIAAAPRMLDIIRDLASAQGVDPDRCKQWTSAARAILRDVHGEG